jgi:hypothetical protein
MSLSSRCANSGQEANQSDWIRHKESQLALAKRRATTVRIVIEPISKLVGQKEGMSAGEK